MITSWVSSPEFSASVLGTTRRASAKASTPSCARCSKFVNAKTFLDIAWLLKNTFLHKIYLNMYYPLNSFLHFVDEVLPRCNLKSPCPLNNKSKEPSLQGKYTARSWTDLVMFVYMKRRKSLNFHIPLVYERDFQSKLQFYEGCAF